MSITYHHLTISVHKFSALNLNFPHDPSHLLLISRIDPSSSSFQSQIPIKSDQHHLGSISTTTSSS